jgi:hypothetical protein
MIYYSNTNLESGFGQTKNSTNSSPYALSKIERGTTLSAEIRLWKELRKLGKDS